MSQENVEVVRRAIESFEDDVDAWLGTLDPEIEWYPEEEGHTPARGYDAVLRVRERWLDTWERSSYRFDIEELTGRGENVVSTVYVTARGTGSGVQIEDRVYVHWKLRNGRIVYVYEHTDRAGALGAAGLPERAMSQENVELVRTYLKLWNAGDMEAVRELHDPDAVMEIPPDWPEPGPFVGRDAVVQQLNQARAAFDSDSVEFLSDLVAVGDRVIVRTGWHGSGRGPQSDMEWTNVFTIRDGRFINVQYFWDHAEALEAAGLRE